MITEVDVSGRLMKMFSGASWLKRVGCQLLCCLTKLCQRQGKVWQHRLQNIRQMTQCLWHKYSDVLLLCKNNINHIPENLAQMLAVEGISHEC